MEQIERIREMEEKLNRARAVLDTFSEALSAFLDVQEDVRALSSYYEGEEWRKDFEDDEAGKLPQDLKRGVLSEDAVYDLLTDNRELLVEMLEAAADLAKWGIA